MNNFTLNIFGYGETQINGDEFSIKVKTNTLTKVQPLVDAIWNLKPSDSQAQQSYLAINVFSYRKIVYMTKHGYTVKTSPELETLIDELISELRVAFENLSNP